MNFKLLFFLLSALFTIASYSQKKMYTYNEFQTRNSNQEWDNCKQIGEQLAIVSATEIQVNIHKNYRLSIFSRTHLPENGTIFLCKDESNKDVTVMILNDDKMIVYDRADRFMIDIFCIVPLDAVAQIAIEE